MVNSLFILNAGKEYFYKRVNEVYLNRERVIESHFKCERVIGVYSRMVVLIFGNYLKLEL